WAGGRGTARGTRIGGGCWLTSASSASTSSASFFSAAASSQFDGSRTQLRQGSESEFFRTDRTQLCCSGLLAQAAQSSSAATKLSRAGDERTRAATSAGSSP